MELAERHGEPFQWLTVTNAGASEECQAALQVLGVSQEELSLGYLCDPATKSDLHIVAKQDILLHLSRNFNKQRGFVNGALVARCGIFTRQC